MRIFYVLIFLQTLFSSAIHAEPIETQKISQDWAREYKIGVLFAKDKDYENAILCFKRACILLPKSSKHLNEVEYATMLAYYLNHQYQEAIHFFETHSLLYANEDFMAYHDLITVLHHCYEILHQPKKADLLLEQIKKFSEKEAISAQLTGAILRKDFPLIDVSSTKLGQQSWVSPLTQNYKNKQKSVKMARWLNMFVPGMGYFYLGQKKAALAAFVLNSFLIWGSIQLFMGQYYTLAALTAIFEIGWYAGGIMGAKEAATLYNETLFANYAEKIIFHEEIIPQNRLHHEF